jgi:hypothetical protein
LWLSIEVHHTIWTPSFSFFHNRVSLQQKVGQRLNLFSEKSADLSNESQQEDQQYRTASHVEKELVAVQ